MAFYLAPISLGFGDLMVSLPALQALIKTGEPTFLITRCPVQEGLEERISGLSGSIPETQFNEMKLSSADRYFNLRNHPLQTDFVWGSEEFETKYPGYTITKVLKDICTDFGISADYERLEPLPFTPKKEVQDAIVLVPGSAGIVKVWPSFYWVELAEKLKKAGHKVIVVGQPDRYATVKECLDAGLHHVPTPTITNALDVLSSARCVIAGDTGLMHLAVQQYVPTVALFRYNIMFLRDYPHVRTLVAPRCHQDCIDIEYSEVPNKVISYGPIVENEKKHYWESWECTFENWNDRCMATIKPEDVVNAINDVLSTSASLVVSRG